MVSADFEIIGLLKLMDTVCLGGEFGQIHDGSYWTMSQYQKVVNFYTNLTQTNWGLNKRAQRLVGCPSFACRFSSLEIEDYVGGIDH